MALVRCKLDDGVRQYVFGHSSLPFDRLVLEVLLGSHHEESPGTMEAIQLRKEVVRTVEDVVGTRLNRYLLHRLGVMNGCCRNVEERPYLGFNIVESMDFYPAFLPPELRPAEDCKAEFNGCRIEGILFEDAAISVLVRLSQVTAGRGVPETEELSLIAVRLHRNNQITQSFSP